jgi:hypothetical protein
MTLVTLQDEHRIRTYGAFRPAKGGYYQFEASGPLTPLTSGRGFGRIDPEARSSVTVPSTARLAVAPSSLRLLVSSRAPEPSDGSVSAAWDTPEKKQIRVKSSAPFPLKECWVVSKETVWRVGEIPAGASLTLELGGAEPFEAWAPKLLLPAREERSVWWSWESPWDRVAAARWGLALTFHEALNRVWNRGGSRHLLLERGVDLSLALAKGDVVLMGSFDRNLSGIRVEPSLDPETHGWVRVRIGGAAR